MFQLIYFAHFSSSLCIKVSLNHLPIHHRNCIQWKVQSFFLATLNVSVVSVDTITSVKLVIRNAGVYPQVNTKLPPQKAASTDRCLVLEIRKFSETWHVKDCIHFSTFITSCKFCSALELRLSAVQNELNSYLNCEARKWIEHMKYMTTDFILKVG